MKIQQSLIIFLFCGLYCGCSVFQESKQKHHLIGKKFEFFRYTELLSGEYRTLDFKGSEATVIAFWARWCSFSRPSVKKMFAYANDGATKEDSIEWIAISIDPLDTLDDVTDWLRTASFGSVSLGFSGNTISDEAYVRLQGNELPHYFVLDRSGTLVFETHDWSEVKRSIKRVVR